MWHPADPIHNVLQDFFEIRIEFSCLVVGFINPFIIYGVLNLVYHAITTCLLVLIDIFLVEYWFDLVMPKNIANVSCNGGLKVLLFQTTKLGLQTEENLIKFYRTFQIYNHICNAHLSTCRIASHSILMMAIAILGSFTLIRYAHLLNSVTELPLMCIMFLSIFFAFSNILARM